MKIAIFGESSADEDAVEILVTAILGTPIDRRPLRSLRARGWSQMLNELGPVIQSLHFGSDAEALVVIADSNGQNLHELNHDNPGKFDTDCRLCALRATAAQTLARLGTRPAQPPLRIAVGMAVPALEAWLLAYSQGGLTEAMVKVARKEGRELYSRPQLKKLLYGTTRPTLELETATMLARMREICENLPRLQTAFPGGFTPLFDEIRSWK